MGGGGGGGCYRFYAFLYKFDVFGASEHTMSKVKVTIL